MSAPPTAGSATRHPVLDLRGLCVRYGPLLALEALDLSVAPGEILVILGPTGAGKTSLLRAIAGLERPYAGKIRMAGEDVTQHSPSARDVSLVFQNFSLYPDRTVRANLEFPLRAPGRALLAPEIAERVEWAARLLRIEPLLARRATQLSGGEMQRVAIGRAIVRRPRLFLMDEPLTNLDAKLREELRLEIPALVRSLGVPLVYVTHDQAEALSMADRIAVLCEGRLLQTGPPEDIYLRPTTPAVARQLGTPPIKLLPATLDGPLYRAPDGTPLAPAPPDAPAHALLGIRPEHLSPTGGPSPATITLIEEAGPTRILLATWGGQTVRLAVPHDFDLLMGETIHPSPLPERLLVWLPDNERIP
jgi:multiple sugar transport system ATP-binding protein